MIGQTLDTWKSKSLDWLGAMFTSLVVVFSLIVVTWGIYTVGFIRPEYTVVVTSLYSLPCVLLVGLVMKNRTLCGVMLILHFLLGSMIALGAEILDYFVAYGLAPSIITITFGLFLVGTILSGLALYRLDFFKIEEDVFVSRIIIFVPLVTIVGLILTPSILFQYLGLYMPRSVIIARSAAVPSIIVLIGVITRQRDFIIVPSFFMIVVGFVFASTLPMLGIVSQESAELIGSAVIAVMMLWGLIIVVDQFGGPKKKKPPVKPIPRKPIAPVSRPVVTEGAVSITSGHDIVGENMKIGVKVVNNSNLAILNVVVNLDVPDGFEFVSNTTASQKIGSIPGGSSQSAIFWLRPLRCVDDEYTGSVMYRDAHNKSHTTEISPKRLVNICPMLSSTERVDDVFRKLKFNALARNCSSFKFTGDSKVAFALAESRLRLLNPVDRSEQTFNDGVYLGYSCYVGQTKYGVSQFAAEIQATGTDTGGVLTLGIYSEDEAMLSGFFADIMPTIREHLDVFEEQLCQIATCPKCGANIDPLSVHEDRVYLCNYCGTVSKVAPWLA